MLQVKSMMAELRGGVFAGVSLCVIAMAMPAFAQRVIEPVRVPTDAVDAILSLPQIPMPDSEDFTIGNRAQIQAQPDVQTKRTCEVYTREKPKVEAEVTKAREQKAKYREFFKQMRPYLNELALRRDAARRLLESYKERKMDPAQIAVLEKQAKLLDDKLREEQARRAQAERNFDKIKARQSYYMNINDFFPECYDKYETYQDPEVEAQLKSAIAAHAAETKAAAGTGAAPATSAPATRLVPSKRVQ